MGYDPNSPPQGLFRTAHGAATSIFGILGHASDQDIAAMGEHLQHRGRMAYRRINSSLVLGGTFSDSRHLNDWISATDSIIYSGRPYVSCHDQDAIELKDLSIPSILMYTLDNSFPLRNLGGSYAAVLWNSSDRSLAIIRDRFGIEPLFIASGQHRHAFASEYKALLALPDVPAQPNRTAVAELQQCGFISPRSCFLQDIKPALCGGITFLDIHGNSSEKRDSLFAPSSEDNSFGGTLSELKQFFGRAVEQIPKNGRSFGIALSGGIDSATLVGAIRSSHPTAHLHTFTVGYGADDPEILGAADTATCLGAYHHKVYVSPTAVFDRLPMAIYHMEDPIGNDEYVCLDLMAKYAGTVVDRIILGNGADAIFAGMPLHRQIYEAQNNPALLEVYRAQWAYAFEGGGCKNPIDEQNQRAGRIPPPVRVLQFDNSALRPPPFSRQRPRPINLATHLRAVLDDYDGRMAGQRLIFGAYGLSVEMPYFDPLLVQTAFQFPVELNFEDGRSKSLLRECARHFLPSTLLDKKKNIQAMPVNLEFSDRLDALCDFYLKPNDVARRDLFSPSDVKRLRRKRRRVPYSRGEAMRLWQVLVTEIWARLFLDGRGRPRSSSVLTPSVR